MHVWIWPNFSTLCDWGLELLRWDKQSWKPRQVAKHEKTCFDNQHVFKPFMFDTFDFLTLEHVDILRRVQRVMHNNVMSPRFMNIVFKRIDLPTKKGQQHSRCLIVFHYCVIFSFSNSIKLTFFFKKNFTLSVLD
jgi:hypothetical protein